MDDWRLLREYVESGSEAAFTALVKRHVDMVHASALRQLRDPHLAKDATQAVFILLARKAASLRSSVILSGWLYRTTVHVASRALRDRTRQQRREEEAGQMNFNESAEELWGKLEPHLDGAIGALSAGDRDAVVLRFLQQRSFRDVAGALGVSEDAAKKRVSRALQKLREHLTARGVAVSAAALLASLTGASSSAAPTDVVLAASTAGAHATAAASTLASSVARQWLFTKLKWTGAFAGAAALFVALVFQANFSRSTPAEAAMAPTPQTSTSVPATADQTSNSGQPAASAPTNLRTMRLQVLSAKDSSPLAGAKAELVFYGNRYIGGNAVADVNGVMEITRPDRKFEGMAFWIAAPGHVPKCLSWKREEELSLPATYVVKLDPGIHLSGQVLNEDGQPVAGAKLRFNGEGIKRNARDCVDYRFPFSVPTSDPDGTWNADYLADRPVFWGFAEHPDYAETEFKLTNSPGMTGTIVIKRGTAVSGVVADADGAPVADAKIVADDYTSHHEIELRSEADGRFVLAHLTPGQFRLKVSANGFNPFEKWFDTKPEGLNIAVKLSPVTIAGKATVRGCVVDETGMPIAGINVTLRAGQPALEGVNWSARTDDAGRFVWNQAPEGTVHLSFSSWDYETVNNVEFTAGAAERSVTVKAIKAPLVRLTVTDKLSGSTVQSFKAMQGQRRRFPGTEEVDDLNFVGESANGSLEFRLYPRQPIGEGEQRLVRVEADGYAPGIVLISNAVDRDLNLAFELERENFLESTVLSPDNAPAAGAEVAMVGGTLGTLMQGPVRFFFSGAPTRDFHTTTRADGTFRLAARKEGERLMIVHDEGWAVVPIAQLGGAVFLQPWGRVEGVLRVGNKPAPGENVSVSSGPSNNFSFHFNGKTDADGWFTFDKVPPGPVLVGRWILSPASRGGSGFVAGTHERAAQVNAGETARINLGRTGIPVRGRLVLQPQVENASPETYPQRLRPLPEGAGSATSTAPYEFFCKTDGTFVIEDVPPGQYELQATVYVLKDRNDPEAALMNFRSGERKLKVTVPENAQSELDLGTIIVPAPKAQ